MTDRKKPGVAFWATVGLVVALAYLLSLGPIFWLMNTMWPGGGAMPYWADAAWEIYSLPAQIFVRLAPESAVNALNAYIAWCLP